MASFTLIAGLILLMIATVRTWSLDQPRWMIVTDILFLLFCLGAVLYSLFKINGGL